MKHNHVEKTIHPCQFPIELIDRLALSLTTPGDLVVDPYIGVGSAACAAVLHERRAAGADLSREYLEVARRRINAAFVGSLRKRPLGKAVYIRGPNDKIAKPPIELGTDANANRPALSHTATAGTAITVFLDWPARIPSSKVNE
jgi:adenine-specific DNA-methyltransferase